MRKKHILPPAVERSILPAALAIMVVALLLSIFNVIVLSSVRSVVATGSVQTPLAAGNTIVPTGVPAIYGAELDVSYDMVSPNDPQLANAAIGRLGNMDRTITLEGADLDRYINILYVMENGISCEYCCGARSIIFPNGEPACGCAHSYAMRGLTKYLITQHGDEYTDAEILEEVGKWKALFFPTQIQQKAAILESNGVELNYINLASNKYRGIEKGTAGGGMVGGC